MPKNKLSITPERLARGMMQVNHGALVSACVAFQIALDHFIEVDEKTKTTGLIPVQIVRGMIAHLQKTVQDQDKTNDEVHNLLKNLIETDSIFSTEFQ